ncbi:hypothetical protein CH354_07700 [Leptospira levettii]|uniref:hypothetical protein n=1 Tax=Leptospira levettii TaxID=2023178 RepID=UPI000C2A359E|nr:hypothetical protein [Leptospira levettii]PJZ36996.1 hypothetical protein CH354_07700 [Leptospira levettii]
MIKENSKINQGTYHDFTELVNKHRDKLTLTISSDKRLLLVVNNELGLARRLGDEYAGLKPLILGQIHNGSYFQMKMPRLRDTKAFILDPNDFESTVKQNINGYFGRMYSPERIHPVIVFKGRADLKIRWDRLHLLDGTVLGLISEKEYFQVTDQRVEEIENWSFSVYELTKTQV